MYSLVTKNNQKLLLFEPYVTAQTSQLQMIKKRFKKHVRKGENSGNKHFPLFPQVLLSFPKESKHSLEMVSNLKFLSLVKD